MRGMLVLNTFDVFLVYSFNHLVTGNPFESSETLIVRVVPRQYTRLSSLGGKCHHPTQIQLCSQRDCQQRCLEFECEPLRYVWFTEGE